LTRVEKGDPFPFLRGKKKKKERVIIGLFITRGERGGGKGDSFSIVREGVWEKGSFYLFSL